MRNLSNKTKKINTKVLCDWYCGKPATTTRLAVDDVEESKMYLSDDCAEVFDQMNADERKKIAYIQGKVVQLNEFKLTV